MYQRKIESLELSKATSFFGLESTEKKQSLYEAVSDQINDQVESALVTPDDLLKAVKDHIFKFLDIYANSEISSEFTEYPAAIALSRALNMTLVIILEGKPTPLIIKQADSKCTIYLAYDAKKQLSSCKTRNVISDKDILELVSKHPTDTLLPLRSDDDRKATLFSASAQAIKKAVKDPVSLGWLQILLGPKINYPTKKFQIDLMNIENEIHLTLLALNAVIEYTLMYLENEFFEKFVEDIKEQKKLTARDIEKRITELRKELKDLQLKRAVYGLKISGESAETISTFETDFHLTYISGPVKFDIPEIATREMISEFEDNNKDEKDILEKIHLIKVEEDEFIKNVSVSVEQLIDNVKQYLQIERSKKPQEKESTQWYDSNRSDISNYIENISAELIQRFYKTPLPAANVSFHAKMYKSILTFQEFLQNSLNRIRFEMKDSYNIDMKVFKDIVDKAYEKEKSSIIAKNERSFILANQNKLSPAIIEKCVSEIKEFLNKKLETQSVEVMQSINKKFVKSPISILELSNFLKNKAIALQSKYSELELSFSNDEAEILKYKNYVTTWFLSNVKQLSGFTRFIPADEFAMMMIATEINKSLESLCEVSTGDTLLHKASALVVPDSDVIDNAYKVILLLIEHGANIFVQNNKRKFAYDFDQIKFLDWSLLIAKQQLETLVTHGSNLADSVVKEILDYLKHNVTSWLCTFHIVDYKLERIKLVWEIMLVLNMSRHVDSDAEIAEVLNYVRSKLFNVNSSYLRNSLIKIFDGMSANRILIDTPLLIRSLRQQLKDEKDSHTETKKLLTDANTNIEVLRPSSSSQTFYNTGFSPLIFSQSTIAAVPTATNVLGFVRKL
jgi:ribosomal protein L29